MDYFQESQYKKCYFLLNNESRYYKYNKDYL